MEYVKLKEICEIKKGKKITESKEITEGSVRYIQIDDLRNNNNVKYCLPNSSYVYVEKRDLIIAWDGANAGTVGFNLEGAIGSTLAKISITDSKIYEPFLALYLQSKFDYFQKTSTGATIPHISRAALENLNVPLLSIEKQKSIYSLLNRINKLILLRQSQISALDELINAYFYDTLKTELKSLALNDLIISTQNGMSRRGNDEEGQPVLKLKNVRNNIVNFNTINRIDLTERELSTYQLDNNDLLVVRVNGNPRYVGRSAVFKGYREPVYFNDHIIRVKVANVNVAYLSYLLNSNLGISEIQKNIKTSAGQYTISRDGLNKIKLMLPNEIVQNEFITKKDIVDSKKAKLKHSLESLETLYNALLQKAFKGVLYQEQEYC
ncbi:hypothetical protein CYL18_14315 [Pradoshia eiseniae]|uniref:Type I restriction modification DNA specificity domain-containing protein n=1 Tax=Pradoshia eiseniae TaxID=2064768 RepID=A0A2S7MX81_9BACI|nr:restriction endonuclease subunit S [Pradoshia eiseniae]PQD94386.1 hypothetical protein CYL18_14315 [Pradoshia eiseniae]